jgi:hypothetical protein
MKWYFKIIGHHTHVKVFINGAKAGDLCFRNEEFDSLNRRLMGDIEFIEEDPGNPIEAKPANVQDLNVREHMQKIAHMVDDQLPAKWGFFVMAFPFGGVKDGRLNYVSNGKIEELRLLMQEFIDKNCGFKHHGSPPVEDATRALQYLRVFFGGMKTWNPIGKARAKKCFMEITGWQEERVEKAFEGLW